MKEKTLVSLTCRNKWGKASRPDGQRTETPSEGTARINIVQVINPITDDVKPFNLRVYFCDNRVSLFDNGSFGVADMTKITEHALVIKAIEKYAAKNPDFFTPGNEEAFHQWKDAVKTANQFPHRQVFDVQSDDYGELVAVEQIGEGDDEIHTYMEGDCLKFRLVFNGDEGQIGLTTEIVLMEDGSYVTREPENDCPLCKDDWIQIIELSISPLLERLAFKNFFRALNNWTKAIAA